MKLSTLTNLGFAIASASAQSFTSIVLTVASTSTTTIVLPAWPTTWTATPATGPTGYNGTSTIGPTGYTPSTVTTAGAVFASVDRSVAGLVLVCMTGLLFM